ncbi:hypothetical protein AZH53_08860 [Methanomicrobiaceae archaeon CYW5]|uniref:hypothetical protein n=1 Tax=Methanovulcanius yangii TaxID=1789227 RepID=UPI0029CAA24B|nr:hypothetical protein [Methanovulcanius yangii]MBT8508515.1 hypothetical protein [Methanovulcanius yangii]
MKEVVYVCPKCGNHELLAEHPDEYEVWLRCQSCDFFMGMSRDDWHHIETSPNANERIRKLADGYT